MSKTTLYKKALRDVRARFGSYAACAMVMGIGLMMYAAMTHVVESIPRAQAAFYTEYRFADAFASVHNMPASRVARLAAVEGVQQADGRLVASARVAGEQDTELKLISYDPSETSRLNDIEVSEGAAPSKGARELVLSRAFYQARGLAPGDTLELALGGHRHEFTVTGAALMPEYIYIVPEGSLFADDSQYGIAYAPLDVMETILNRHGERNDVSVTLNAPFEDVERALTDALSPYGLLRLTPRKDQLSNLMLDQEIVGMRAVVSVVPIAFLSIGALIMSVVVKRAIEQQRAQIGLMKAFGYTPLEILGHYALHGVVIGTLASVFGAVVGRALSSYFAELYQVYFHMPGISGAFSLESVAGLSLLALLFAAGASLYGARGVLKLSAAAAMHPPAPKHGKPIMIERLRFLWGVLAAHTRMALRNLFRMKSRSLATVIGLTVCYALTAAVFAMWPMIDYMMDQNFRDVQRYDMKIDLNAMTDARVLEQALDTFGGIHRVEASLELPATVRAGAREKNISILALPSGTELYRLYDRDRNPVRMPARGAVITYRLAQSLNISVGDELLLDFAYPDKEIRLPVAALTEQYVSNYVIVDNTYLGSLLRMQPMANGAMVKLIDADGVGALTARLEDGENISAISSTQQMRQFIYDTIETSMQTLYVMALMSVFAGFAIVYNASVVSLGERTRELASMRVMGFTLFETVRVVSVEQLYLLFAGMLAGMPLANTIMYGLSASMSTDAYSMPYGVPASTHVEVAACLLGAWVLALFIIARKVRRTSMVDVLKTRE